MKSKSNKAMFYTGIILVIIAAILLLGDFIGDHASPVILGVIGIVFIGASKYRLLKSR